MAIKINSLEQIAKTYTDQQYVYKDLSLDIKYTKIKKAGFNTSITSSDIKADFDVSAIKNSLTNLFNTLPGQRFLFPEYGLDLYQFIFEPITVNSGDLIGNAIFNGIKTFEPRVNPRQVRVVADPDNNQYLITIIIDIPIYNITVNTDYIFNTKNESFIFIETSKNK
jgi:phage baseplate assembly protein W